MNNKPVIILSRPQMGENIGAAARVMKNFGLYDLRIVSPRDGWPNPAAEAMSAGAIDIIQNAQIFADLKSATYDLEYLYVTCATSRDLNKEYVLSTELKNDTPHKKVGVIFGREASGLSNEEISYGNKILVINTNPEFSSLNLAQAIGIICYELGESYSRPDLENNNQEPYNNEQLQYFFDSLFDKLDETNFFKVLEKKPQMMLNIKNIFTRIPNLSKRELQTLQGIIVSLAKK